MDLSCNPIIDVSRVTFCDDIILDTAPPGFAIDPNIVIGQDTHNDGSRNIIIGNRASAGTGTQSIILGYRAGHPNVTGDHRVAIGTNVQALGGFAFSGNIGIGHQAGGEVGGDNTISIGRRINANMAPREGAISIGYNAGAPSSVQDQGEYSIALGAHAGQNDICDNSIIINATGTALDNDLGPSRLFIKPIRNDVSNNVLYYTPSTGEVTYGQAGSVPLDLSCNPIIDVSSITFCDGTYIGPGNSFDISTNEVLKINVKDASNALVVDQSGNILLGTDTSLPHSSIPSYLYFKGRGVSGETGPYISIDGPATGNQSYQSAINLLTKGTFTTPSFSNTTKGWHIVAKGDAYQGTFLAGQTGNMMSFYFKNEEPNYISGFHIAGQSPNGAIIDYSGAEIGMGNVPIPGVSLFIDPSNNRGGGGAKTQGAIRIAPVGNVDTGELQFMERSGSGTNYVGFKAPDSIPANIVWKLPNSDGLGNEVLKTDGFGNLSWEPIPVDPWDVSCNSITDVSYISFCGHNSVGIDLSCNTIIDISGLHFCDGTFIGHGNSFDISTNEVFKIRTTDISNALVVDQSGNVGIGTANPEYLLDIHRPANGDAVRIKRTNSGALDFALLFGFATPYSYINSGATTSWPDGAPLRLRSGGTSIVTCNSGPLSGVAYPYSFDLTSEKLIIGGIEGTAGQVVQAKGDGFGGVEWGTGSGSDGSGNGAIPYEPWNVNVTHIDVAVGPLVDQTAYCIQFFAPATASYTNMVVLTSSTSTAAYTGTLGVAICSNTTGQPGTPTTGAPLGSGFITFSGATNPQERYSDIAFSSPIDLSANTIYWAVFGADNTSGNLYMGFHADYHSPNSTVRQGVGDFVAGTFTIGATADSEYACWFRIYNEYSSFATGPVGPAGPAGPPGGPTGPPGPAGPPNADSAFAAIPYEPWNLDITLSEMPLTDQIVYCIQFFAPTTAAYTNMVIFTTGTSANAWVGQLGVAIYSNTPGQPGTPTTGAPLGSGFINYTGSTNPDLRYHDIAFSSPIDLSANTQYWAVFAADNDGAGNLYMGFHNDYNSVYQVVRQGPNLSTYFVAGTFTMGATINSDAACWFRIYNDNVSFGGLTGPTGPATDLSGIPNQMAFFNTSTQLVGTPLAEVSGNQILFGGGGVGNAAAPSISFLTDASQGIYLQASSTLLPAPAPFAAIGPGPAVAVDGTRVLGFGSAGFVPNYQIGQWEGDFINITGNIYTNDPVGKIQSYGGGEIISGNPGAIVGGGLVRASAGANTDWKDGNCGNFERLYFTFTDFHGPMAGATTWNFPGTGPRFNKGVAYGVAGPWIASKLIPVGFRLPNGARVNILTEPTLAISFAGRLSVQTVLVSDTGAAGGGAGSTFVFHGPALTPATSNTPSSLSNTPSTGSGTGTGTHTEMITIEVQFNVAPVGPEGLIGAYVDIERF